MRWIQRVNRVVSAELHGVIESFERPERILKQLIREMEFGVRQSTEATARAIAGERRLTQALADCRNHALRWRERARDAVQAGDEASARTALARQKEIERAAEPLAGQLDRTVAANIRLRLQLDMVRGRLADAKAQLVSLTARQRSAEALRQFTNLHDVRNVDTAAFDSFAELADRIHDLEAEAEATLELSGQSPSVELTDREMERELEQLKREAGLGPA